MVKMKLIDKLLYNGSIVLIIVLSICSITRHRAIDKSFKIIAGRFQNVESEIHELKYKDCAHQEVEFKSGFEDKLICNYIFSNMPYYRTRCKICGKIIKKYTNEIEFLKDKVQCLENVDSIYFKSQEIIDIEVSDPLVFYIDSTYRYNNYSPSIIFNDEGGYDEVFRITYNKQSHTIEFYIKEGVSLDSAATVLIDYMKNNCK